MKGDTVLLLLFIEGSIPTSVGTISTLALPEGKHKYILGSLRFRNNVGLENIQC